MRYYIIAGERSGDLHGGNLLNALRLEDPNAVMRGFGGEKMKEAGMELFVHYDELAFMGFVALITNIFKIFDYISRAKKDIEVFKPDVLVLIDYGGFNRRIAKYGRKNGIRIFYYIPPKVWAWYQRRAWELKTNVDRMFVILPFEKKFYKKYDFEVDYVGNPVLDAIKSFQSDLDFQQSLHQRDKPLIALLPGSRKMELKWVVPLMAEVVKRNPGFHYAVAAIDNLGEELYAPLKDDGRVTFVYNKTYDLLMQARAAIVTSGTATLETCLFKVPQVVIYKTGGLEFWVVKQLVKVPWISLVNLIADKEVVKELIQDNANVEALNLELKQIVADGTYRNDMLKEYNRIYKILDTGSASANTAKLMVKYLMNEKS